MNDAGHQNKLKSSISPVMRARDGGYLPARVDIGIRGHMPFDEQLLTQNRSPMSIRGAKTLSVIDPRKRGKSQLGFAKTIFSTVTSNGQSHYRHQGDSLANDYEYVVSTNHPGTLLKNINPKIAPKN